MVYTFKEIELIFMGYFDCIHQFYQDDVNYYPIIQYLKNLTNDLQIIKDVFDNCYGKDGLDWAHYDIETDKVVLHFSASDSD